jgi:hypothetical protein
MKNLLYDLPLDIQEIIFKKKYEVELKEKYMKVIAELKAFDRLKWSADRWVQKQFPYNEHRYNDHRIIKNIIWFYEEKVFPFEPLRVLLYSGEYVTYSTYNERDFEESFKYALKWLRCRPKDECEAVESR